MRFQLRKTNAHLLSTGPDGAGVAVADAGVDFAFRPGEETLSVGLKGFPHLLHRLSGILPHRNTITVDIHEGYLRMVAFRGKNVIRWATLALPEEGSDSIPPIVAGSVSQFGRWSKNAIANLPARGVLARQLTLTKINRRYLKQVIDSEVMESIPFSTEEVDIVRASHKASLGTEAVAVVASKSLVDAQVNQYKRSGIRLSALYHRGSALAAVAGRAELIIVEVQAQAAYLVLILGGIPKAVHTVPLATASPSHAVEAEGLLKAVDQLAARYETPDAALKFPVLVAGDFRGRQQLRSALYNDLNREMVSPQTGFKSPAHFSSEEYAANLGLYRLYVDRPRFLRHLPKGAIIPLNILSARYAARPKKLLVFGAGMALVLFGYAAFGFNASIDAVSLEKTELSTIVGNLDRQERLNRLSQLEAQAALARSSADAQLITKVESKLQSMDKSVESLLSNVRLITVSSVPEGVVLSTFSYGEDGVSLNGKGRTYRDVMLYAANLRASGAFGDVRILGIQPAGLKPGADAGGVAEGAPAGVGFQLRASAP